ncbi:MAG: hypothetical protein ABJH04_07345 [Cyclobacteriaceae bacterium]
MVTPSKGFSLRERFDLVIAALRDNYAFILRVISELEWPKLLLIFISIPSFLYFLFTNRFSSFLINIQHVIKGHGNAIELLSDGVIIILMILTVFYVTQHIAFYDRVPRQTNNHQAIKEIILPKYIHQAYLPVAERVKKLAEQEQVTEEIQNSSNLLMELLGFDIGLVGHLKDALVQGGNLDSDMNEQVALDNLEYGKVKEELAITISNALRNQPLDEGLDIVDVDVVADIVKELEIEEK